MKTKTALTRSQLAAAFSYNPVTGLFSRKDPNKIKRYGPVVGTLTASGYRHTIINGLHYYCHRLAYLYMTGKWPEAEIDHLNGKPDDNRWSNLRPAFHQQNCMNMKLPTHNRSGHKGVYWSAHRRKWTAQISFKGKMLNLGRFARITDAIACRRKKARELFGAFDRA